MIENKSRESTQTKSKIESEVMKLKSQHSEEISVIKKEYDESKEKLMN